MDHHHHNSKQFLPFYVLNNIIYRQNVYFSGEIYSYLNNIFVNLNDGLVRFKNTLQRFRTGDTPHIRLLSVAFISLWEVHKLT